MANALVVGCSADVWGEVYEAKALTKFDAVYCVKLSGVYWNAGPFVWCSLHPEWMDEYEAERAKRGLPKNYEIVAPPPGEVGMHGSKGKVDRRVSYRYPGMDSSASSGGFAAKVALDDGYDRVVLAGIPMQQEANHFTRGKPWLQRDSFTIGFEKSVPFFAGRVRSMSGWSKEILGGLLPTPEWLNGATP